jgi:hypothetical protein
MKTKITTKKRKNFDKSFQKEVLKAGRAKAKARKALPFDGDTRDKVLDSILDYSLNALFPFLPTKNNPELSAEVRDHLRTHPTMELGLINGAYHYEATSPVVLKLRAMFNSKAPVESKTDEQKKIFVTVSGGVAEVCEDTVPPGFDVEIVDFDNIKTGDDFPSTEAEARFKSEL